MKHYALIPFLILFLFSCQSETPSLISEHNLIELNKLLKANNKASIKRLESLYREIKSERENSEKFRSYGFYEVMRQTISEYVEFLDLKNNLLEYFQKDKRENMNERKISIYNNLLHDLQKRDSLIFSRSKENLIVNYSKIGLKDNEYQSYISTLKRQLDHLQLNLKIASKEEIGNHLKFEFFLNSLEASALQRADLFIETNQIFTSVSIYSTYYLFPIISPKTFCPKKGEYFKAKIGIGHFYNLDFENIDLIVNKDTLEVNENNGTADFQMKVDSSGSYQLELKFNFHSRDGKTYSESSFYDFTVD